VKPETQSAKPETSRLAVVALGSNLGDSPAILRAAMDELARLAAGAVRRSSLWRSTPVDCPPGSPDFLNAVVAFLPVAGETPESLLEKLGDLEARFGRKRSGIVNEPRPLDLDLIAFGDERRATAQLTLPHPRATERQFVLAPLAEILPDFQAPGWPADVLSLLQLIPAAGRPVRR
jgi:2-amino-4-hydroxy-6-hydroxymethyldihydropteridine diphosphokinase